MEREEVVIPPLTLEWSPWVRWDEIAALVAAGGTRLPIQPGVYEARQEGESQRLTIGKAANLRMRIKQGLVRGKLPHSAGKKIRAHEELSSIVVRWAITDRPAAVEEYLHQEHRRRFGRLPKYVDHT